MTNTQTLIADLTEAETVAELEAALSSVHIDPHKLRAAADALEGLYDDDAAQGVFIAGFVDAGVPVDVVNTYVDTLRRWHALKNETPEQRAIREAFAHARTLMDTLGDEHPQTLAAVFDAMELKEPGCVGRIAQECGLNLPKPDHCDDRGRPLFSSQAIAEALDVPHEQVVADIKAMIGGGITSPAGAVHRLQ